MVASLTFLVTMALLAVFAGAIAPHQPNAQDCAAGALTGPSGDHILGTDGTCRDVLSRLLHGARVSLAIGVLTPLAIVLIALPVGSIASASSRWVDNALMRTADLSLAFPDLLLVILLSQAMADRGIPGGTLAVIIFAVALVAWPAMARLVRAQMLSLRGEEFVLAAEAIGAGKTRIVLQHLLPNSLGPLLVALTFAVPQAIFAEAALSFLGLGIAPPQATWGGMINAGYDAIYAQPLLVVYPAVAIGLTMLAFLTLAEGLRDALDPRLPHKGPAALLSETSGPE